MCPGVCKDRLADAFARFGRVPIEKRRIAVSPDHPIFRIAEEPFWSAGGLVHDGHRRVLLVRHSSESAWGEAWVTPGGRLEEGETTVDGFRREVREEVGLDVVDPILTRILQQTLEGGSRARHGYFAQFIARASGMDVRPGRGVIEAKWFDQLPPNLAFRDDYLRDFEQIPQAASF
jgi:ADP-ribose pyrophosphatase YjhB (NUDIX family)